MVGEYDPREHLFAKTTEHHVCYCFIVYRPVCNEKPHFVMSGHVGWCLMVWEYTDQSEACLQHAIEASQNICTPPLRARFLLKSRQFTKGKKKYDKTTAKVFSGVCEQIFACVHGP